MSEKAQTIFRAAQRSNLPFTQLSNEMLRDKRLSFEAQGILTHVLSYPPDWDVHPDQLFKDRQLARDRGRAHVRLLVELGYARRTQPRGNRARFGAYVYLFTDCPGDFGNVSQEEASPQTDCQSPVTKPVNTSPSPRTSHPAPDHPAPDSQSHTKKERGQRKKETKKEQQPREKLSLKVEGDPLLGISDAAMARGLKLANGCSREELLEEFAAMPEPHNPGAAWLGFCEKKGTQAKKRGVTEAAVKALEVPTKVTPKHPAWTHWLDKIVASGRRDLADQIQLAGAMMCAQAFPRSGLPLPSPVHEKRGAVLAAAA